MEQKLACQLTLCSDLARSDRSTISETSACDGLLRADRDPRSGWWRDHLPAVPVSFASRNHRFASNRLSFWNIRQIV